MNDDFPKTYFDLMEKVGTDGPYQRNVFLIFFFNCFIAGLLIMQTAFLFLNYEFDCEGKGLSVSDCSRYVCSLPEQEWKNYLSYPQKNNTINNYNQIVCNKSENVLLQRTISFIGIFLGYIVLSFISDNYGRKKSLLISWFSAIIGILLLFYYIHVGLVLILVGSESSIRICLIILSEIASNSIRQKYSIGLMISFGVAGIGVGVIYYLIDDWVAVNIFLLFFSLISFFFLCYYLEEMTKFVIKGQIQENIQKAKRSLNKIAKINQKDQITRHEIAIVLRETCDDDSQFHKIICPLDIFCFQSLQKQSVCCCIIFMLINYMYYGPQTIIQKVGFSPYLKQIIVGSSQFLAFPLAYILIKKGNKRKQLGIFLLSISFLLTLILLFKEKSKINAASFEIFIQLSLVFSLRFIISLQSSIFLIYVIELYPSKIRGQGLGVISAFEIIGGSFADILFNLLFQKGIEPMIFVSICGFIAPVMFQFLPETFQRQLTQEIQEIQERKNFKVAQKNQRQMGILNDQNIN